MITVLPPIIPNLFFLPTGFQYRPHFFPWYESFYSKYALTLTPFLKTFC